MHSGEIIFGFLLHKKAKQFFPSRNKEKHCLFFKKTSKQLTNTQTIRWSCVCVCVLPGGEGGVSRTMPPGFIDVCVVCFKSSWPLHNTHTHTHTFHTHTHTHTHAHTCTHTHTCTHALSGGMWGGEIIFDFHYIRKRNNFSHHEQGKDCLFFKKKNK